MQRRVMLWGLLSVVGDAAIGQAQDNDIFSAVKAGDVARVKELLGGRTSLVNARDTEGNATPLFYAACNESVEIVKLLITSGANVNADNKNGNTPLHCAATKGLAEVARLLIANGANVNASNRDGTIPLHNAAFAGAGNPEVARLLIASGSNVNAVGLSGSTPLHQAALGGYLEIAKLLLDSRANADAVSISGMTPLHYAAWQFTTVWDANRLIGKAEVAKLLIAKGANTLAKEKTGKQAIDLAREKGFSGIVSVLEKYPHECDQCHGRGKVDRSESAGSVEKRCYNCAGKGETVCEATFGWPHSDERYKDGRQMVCSKCRGTGRIRCTVCSGSGVITQNNYRNWTEACSKCRGTGILPVKALAPSQPARSATPTRRPVTKRKP